MLVQRLHKTAASKDITFAIHYVHTTRNPADEPSRSNMDELEKLNSTLTTSVFQPTVKDMTREEVVSYWFRQYSMQLPDKSTAMWMLKILNFRKDSAGRLLRASVKALEDW